MRRKGRVLLCFLGIDGSGKTTLATATARELSRRGLDSICVYGRYKPILARPLMAVFRFFFLKKSNPFEDYRKYSRKRESLLRNPLFSLVFESLVVGEYVLQIWVKVALPLLLRKSVVCDRYIYDTVVTDLAIDLGYSNVKLSRVAALLSSLLPEPDIQFLIDVPEECSLKRKNDIPSVEYLVERRRLYLWVAHNNPVILLDGSQSISELEDVVRACVSEELP